MYHDLRDWNILTRDHNRWTDIKEARDAKRREREDPRKVGRSQLEAIERQWATGENQ